jgi:hypothetical protein
MKITGLNNQQSIRFVDGSSQYPEMVQVGNYLYVLDNNAVVRLHLDGTLDKSFDGDGLAYLGQPGLRAYQVTADASSLSVFSAINKTYPGLSHQVTTFPLDGISGHTATTTPLPGLQGDGASEVAHGNGSVYLAGNASASLPFGTLVKIDASGNVDAVFAANATAAIGQAQEGVAAMTADVTGRLYVLGTVSIPADYTANVPAHFVPQLLRLLPSGQIDTTFGQGGIVDLGKFGKDIGAQSIALLANGDVLVGVAGEDAGVIRVHANGTLDTGFGTGGLDTVNLNGTFPAEYTAAILVDGNAAFAAITSYPDNKITLVPIDSHGFVAAGATKVFDTSIQEHFGAHIDPASKTIVLAVPTWKSGGIETVAISYAVDGAVPSAPPVTGTSGNDRFKDTASADLIDGGPGTDHMVYAGKFADYSVRADRTGVTVTDRGTGATDTLTNVERLDFADQSLGFDADGTGGQAYRIYRAALGREPDKAGLGFFISALEHGTPLVQIAQGFVDSAEYHNYYADVSNHEQLVGKYYLNVLGRPPENAGLDYWTHVLDSGAATEAQVLVAFSESAENHAAVIGGIQQGFSYIAYG